MRWIEKMEKNAELRPSATAIVDTASGVSISYEKLDDLSGKIYHALKEEGIGKEDVVMICLPRGYYPFVAAVGVWKAGAAVVILEANAPKEKKEYIYKNSEAVCLIDGKKYRSMTRGKSQKGHEETDLHDKAYLVYTSGSTGLPKGVVHEYGSMEMCVKAANYEGTPLYEESDRFALTSNLHFSATFLLSLPLLYQGGTLLVIPLEFTMNVNSLTRCLTDYRVTSGFFTPSLLKMFRQFPPEFRKLIVAAEPARNIFYEGITSYNLYGQSESGYYCCAFRIDRPYKLTPIGKSHLPESGCCILNGEGEAADKGEIYYKNPYFRGYLGYEDRRADLEDALIPSGDLGRYLSDGSITITGRMDNMVKIHGNRVELEELETILRDVMEISWVGVRVSKTRNQEFVCAYYVDELKLSLEEVKNHLQARIPRYMIPAFFVKIEQVPCNANGKFDRNALPVPKIEDYQEDYVNPVGKLEQELCNVMAKVLGLSSFSAKDDFFNLGGDSISTVELLAELNWPYLDISMVYDGKSPRKIANIYKKILGGMDLNMDERNDHALKEKQALSINQIYMLHYQTMMDQSTVWNIPLCFRLSQEVDLERFQMALCKTMECHPVFASRYYISNDSRLLQRYDPKYICYPEIVHLTEEEFQSSKASFVKPFLDMEKTHYRIMIIVTEEANYLFMDFHHSIMDGTSLHIFVEDIQKAYEGLPLEKDYYYLYLEEKIQEKKSSRYDEGREYFSRLLDGEKWTTYPKADFNINDHSYGNLSVEIPLKEEVYRDLKESHGMSKNAFFIAVATLAIAAYNQEDRIRISWVFNGRKTKLSQNIVGCLIQDCYIGIRLDSTMTLADYFEEIQEQIRMNLYYSCYSYPGPERMIDEGEDASLLYQSGLRSFKNNKRELLTKVNLEQKSRFADNILDMEILDNQDRCILYMDYIASMYKKESMEKFADTFIQLAQELAVHMHEEEYAIMDLRDLSFLDQQ